MLCRWLSRLVFVVGVLALAATSTAPALTVVDSRTATLTLALERGALAEARFAVTTSSALPAVAALLRAGSSVERTDGLADDGAPLVDVALLPAGAPLPDVVDATGDATMGPLSAGEGGVTRDLVPDQLAAGAVTHLAVRLREGVDAARVAFTLQASVSLDPASTEASPSPPPPSSITLTVAPAPEAP